MVEQTLLETLFEAIASGEYTRIIGLVLLSLCALSRFIFGAKFPKSVKKWASATTHLLAGVGTALAAGGIWWQALALGVFASTSSNGFLELVRSALARYVTRKVGKDDLNQID